MQPNNALGPLEITDDDVTASKPRVRALLIARLESMWEPVRVRVKQDADGVMPIDPRILELGLRICKELGLHYQMYKAQPLRVEEEDDLPGVGIDRAAAIESTLQELEAKLRPAA